MLRANKEYYGIFESNLLCLWLECIAFVAYIYACTLLCES